MFIAVLTQINPVGMEGFVEPEFLPLVEGRAQLSEA